MSKIAARVRETLDKGKVLIKKQEATSLFFYGTIILLAGMCLYMLVTILSQVLLFDGYAANGAFQLLNPLRRIADGQIIGSDFNFFHGVGVPLIHFPFYLIFGQGLIGSEIARWVVSPLVFVGTSYLFLYFALGKRPKLALGLTIFAASIAALFMMPIILPATSLLSVRSGVAVVLMTLILMQARFMKPVFKNIERAKSFTFYELIAGLLLALGLICGTEFGLAALLGFFIAHFAYPAKKEGLKLLALSAARILVIFVVGLVAILSVVTLGNPMAPLKFAFIDVPTDQFWYFGAPPNDFLYLDNVIARFLSDTPVLKMWAIAILAIILIIIAFRKKIIDRFYGQAFIFGMLAGAFSMVSMLGYYHSSEAAAFARIALLISLVLIIMFISNWKNSIKISAQIKKAKKHFTFGRHELGVFLGWVFLLYAVVYFTFLAVHTFTHYDTKQTLIKTRDFIFGYSTDILGERWNAADTAVMSVIQADNSVSFVDVNNDEYSFGVSKTQPKVVVRAGDKAKFVKPGQVVFFAKSGRQVIKSVKTEGDNQIVTLQNPYLRLSPEFDGAPAKMIIAESFDKNPNKVWSLYTSLFEAEMGVFHPSSRGYDYIIHALGKEHRQRYLEDFKNARPEFVITLSKPYFRYEEWLQNAHWDFYSLLDQNYEAVKETSMHVVWKRKGGEWLDTHKRSQEWQALEVIEPENRIRLPELTFDNVADVEAYDMQQIIANRDFWLKMGVDVPAPDLLRDEEFYNHFIEDLKARRDKSVSEKENSGGETNALEHLSWLEDLKKVTDYNTPLPLNERPKRQVILVKLKYEVSHPLEKLPVFGKTVRYLVEGNNVFSTTAISLRPYENEITFPIVLSEKNKDPYLRWRSQSLMPGDGRIKITDAEWTVLDTDVANLKVLTDNL